MLNRDLTFDFRLLLYSFTVAVNIKTILFYTLADYDNFI